MLCDIIGVGYIPLDPIPRSNRWQYNLYDTLGKTNQSLANIDSASQKYESLDKSVSR